MLQARKRVRFCAILRLRATVSVGHSRRSSGTQPMPERAISWVGLRVTSRSSNLTAPRQPEDRAQHGSLAGTVGTEQREHFSALDGQRGAEQCLGLAVKRIDRV